MRQNTDQTSSAKSTPDTEKRRSLRPQTKQAINVSTDSLSPSTPPLASPGKVKRHFKIGEEVLARWSDGLFYLGLILKVDERRERCFMKFEDDSEYWALFKDITKGPSQRPEDIRCIVCEGEASDKPNEIVLCDKCGIGYHQECHMPQISSDVLKPDVNWVCRPCVFAQSAKKGGASKKGPNARAMQELKKSLPYDLKMLSWDAQHKNNEEQIYCYCGGPGDWYMQMLQCSRCRQWFHEACMQCLKQPLLFGDKFYIFICAHCNHGPEYLRRLQVKWLEVVHLALFNLAMENSVKYYDLDNEIIPWIHNNWTKLQPSDSIENSPESEWRRMVLDCLLHNNKKFQCGKEIKKRTTLWGLRVRQPPPLPHVTLPQDGRLTDSMINQALSKVQYINHDTSEGLPIPYRQKRKISETEDPMYPKKNKKRKLNFTPPKSNKSSVRQHSGILTTNKSPSGAHKKLKFGKKEDGKRDKQTLDTIIPWPKSYDGLDHPFKTVLERNQEIAHNRLKERLLNSYSNGYLNGDIEQSSDSFTETTDSDGRSMTPIDEVLPSGRLGKKKKIIQKLEIKVKKKRGRKSKAELALLAAAAEQARKDKERKEIENLKKNRKLPAHAKNVIDKSTLDGMSKREIPLNQLKSSVSSYFGAADRLAQGERFKVLARRVTTAGKIQYLVEWEGLIP